MRALVVYESMFGNTRQIAEAVAEGLSTGATVEIADAVTHGAPSKDLEIGIRSWLGTLPVGGHPQDFAAFDTRVDVHLIPGAASRAATRAARKLGFRTSKPESFLVEGYEGPLAAGELDRAREWGIRFAKDLSRHSSGRLAAASGRQVPVHPQRRVAILSPQTARAPRGQARDQRLLSSAVGALEVGVGHVADAVGRRLDYVHSEVWADPGNPVPETALGHSARIPRRAMIVAWTTRATPPSHSTPPTPSPALATR